MHSHKRSRLPFDSRKHRDRAARSITKPRTALVVAILLFGIVGRLNAATVGVSSADVTDVGSYAALASYELISFVAGGRNYTQSDLIQPTLTEFKGVGDLTIANTRGGSLPPAATRSLLLTHDFNLNTGIINPGLGATAATLQFSPALINGPGPDLVMFAAVGGGLLMRVNGNTVTYPDTSFGLGLGPFLFQGFTRDAGPPQNILEMENDSYSDGGLFGGRGDGIAIDLDDFGVGPLEIVTTVQFGGETSTNNVDPLLFMGINSVVPEPSTAILTTIALAGLLVIGWGRRTECLRNRLTMETW